MHCVNDLAVRFPFPSLLAVEDTTNLPPSPPPSPAAEHFGPLEQGRATVFMRVCVKWRGVWFPSFLMTVAVEVCGRQHIDVGWLSGLVLSPLSRDIPNV